MRFALIILAAVVVAMVGLFLYGHLLEPDTHVIEQEALSANGV